ncbi:hypothetical protein HY522_10165 [bacterium]|nr:hypothetical protein [bacterium]
MGIRGACAGHADGSASRLDIGSRFQPGGRRDGHGRNGERHAGLLALRKHGSAVHEVCLVHGWFRRLRHARHCLGRPRSNRRPDDFPAGSSGISARHSDRADRPGRALLQRLLGRLGARPSGPDDLDVRAPLQGPSVHRGSFGRLVDSRSRPDGRIRLGQSRRFLFLVRLPDPPARLTIHAKSAFRSVLHLDEPFDLRSTLASGAAFGWGRYDRRGRLLSYGEPDADGWFTAPTYGTVVRLRQPAAREIELECGARQIGPCKTPDEFVRWYFRMEEKFSDIAPVLEKDPHVAAAYRALPGLRLIRVEPMECLLTFLCSPQNRILKIARILNEVGRAYGRRVESPWGTFYLPPGPEILARARSVRLAKCGLRYGRPQAKNIIRTFREVARDPGFWRTGMSSPRSSRLRKSQDGIFFNLRRGRASHTYEETHRRLRETCMGAGPKVADCVCLFGLGLTEAVPVDVHVFNATLRLYRRNLRGLRAKDADFLSLREYERIGRFYRRRFGRWAGYAQQFLFTAERLRRKLFARD